MVNIQSDSLVFLCQFHRILDNSQSPKAQEIHFQKSQFFQRCHGKLCNQGTVGGSGKRHILIHRLLADNHACRMHRGVSGQSFQTPAHIDKLPHRIIRIIQFF